MSDLMVQTLSSDCGKVCLFMPPLDMWRPSFIHMYQLEEGSYPLHLGSTHSSPPLPSSLVDLAGWRGPFEIRRTRLPRSFMETCSGGGVAEWMSINVPPEGVTNAPAGALILDLWDTMRRSLSSDTSVPDTEIEDHPMTKADAPTRHESGYISRVLAGDVSDFDLLDHARKNRENVLLYGPTQSGKTSLPVHYALKHDLRCVTISGDAAMDPSELFGHRTIRNGEDGYSENHVTEVIREGGVLVIDEINKFSPKILSPLFSLLDHRREIRIRDKGGEVIPAHEDLLIVATMNPRYAGTVTLSEAILDRFHHRHEWDYDPRIEEVLVPYPQIREMFGRARKGDTIDTPMSTSLMIQFAKDIQSLGYEYASTNLSGRAMDSEERRAIKLLTDTFADNIESDFLSPEERAKREEEARSLWTVDALSSFRNSEAPAYGDGPTALADMYSYGDGSKALRDIYANVPPAPYTARPAPGTKANAAAPWD